MLYTVTRFHTPELPLHTTVVLCGWAFSVTVKRCRLQSMILKVTGVIRQFILE